MVATPPILPGRLFVVSVGVGDSDNITLKALKTIEAADVVLGMKFILKQHAHLLEGKECHDAGHACFLDVAHAHGPRPVSRERELEIIRVVRTAVAAGRNVAVLDFGDPTLYGPQVGFLAEFADLSPEIVPGISSVNAANAVLGKELSGAFDKPVVLTHGMDSGADYNRLETLADTGATLVFFTMGMDLEQVAARLKKRLGGDMPAVIIAKAGFADSESVVSATLDTIVDAANGTPSSWAFLLYVGDALK